MLQRLQQICALHHSRRQNMVLDTEVPQGLGRVALQVLLGETRGRRWLCGPRRLCGPVLFLLLPLPVRPSSASAAAPASSLTGGGALCTAAAGAAFAARLFSLLVALHFLGQNWDLRQRAGVYADHVGHRPCEVGPFPHGQQQFLPQHLVVLQKRLHVASALAPARDEEVCRHLPELLLALHHLPLRRPRQRRHVLRRPFGQGTQRRRAELQQTQHLLEDEEATVMGALLLRGVGQLQRVCHRLVPVVRATTRGRLPLLAAVAAEETCHLLLGLVGLPPQLQLQGGLVLRHPGVVEHVVPADPGGAVEGELQGTLQDPGHPVVPVVPHLQIQLRILDDAVPELEPRVPGVRQRA
mmetsp:Transcript_23212/g.55142  ORF Transcript_23212/g.55142 Transcript_23212/m.55142 type:complete len:354 (-) Transcript_23212:180-1241(-)